jgi:hypothetical protein
MKRSARIEIRISRGGIGTDLDLSKRDFNGFVARLHQTI